MNWEAISGIGEILGAIAVVVTLLYLTREVRQNARSLSISALRDTTAQWNHWSEMIATSDGLAEIVVKGNMSFHELSESEKLRYSAWVQSFFDNAESYRSLVIDHEMDNKDLTDLESIVARRLLIPGFTSWWVENTPDYADDFVAWVNSLRVDT